MHRLYANLFDFDSDETPGQRMVFRALEVFLVGFTLKFCWEWGLYIQGMAGAAFPAGLGRYIDLSFMYGSGASLVLALAVTALCASGILRKGPRWAYLGALLLMHVQYVARYSLGKLPHGSAFVGMGLLALALAVYCFHEEKERRRFALGFIYFFMGLGYALAAVSKLVGTGLNWPDGIHLIMWMQERRIDVLSATGSFEWNPLQSLILSTPTLGTAMLAFGLLAEACGVLIWFRKTRYFIMPALIGMHIGVALTMNIYFMEFIYQLLILGLPWAGIIDKVLASRSPAFAGASGAGTSVAP